MLRRRGLAAVCALLLLGQGGDVDRVLDGWEAKVGSLASFKCRFRQEKKVSFMRRPLVSTGTIAYRDRRLLWKTESPSAGFLSVDANEVRIYTPEFRTLEILELRSKADAGKVDAGQTDPGKTDAGKSDGGKTDGSGTGGGAKPAATKDGGASGSALAGAFPGFTGDLRQVREVYDVELVPAESGAAAKETRLRLTPRKEELKKEVTAVEITLSAEFDVRAWRIVRANGDELALTLQDFEANAKVSDDELNFTTPPDTKVVRLGAMGGTR